MSEKGICGAYFLLKLNWRSIYPFSRDKKAHPVSLAHMITGDIVCQPSSGNLLNAIKINLSASIKDAVEVVLSENN